MASLHSSGQTPRYLEPQGLLKPANAAVALIIDEQGRYLVQLRDAKPTIFFPDHWGCFGGALEPGETDEQCLAREIDEELGLDLQQLRRVPLHDFHVQFRLCWRLRDPSLVLRGESRQRACWLNCRCARGVRSSSLPGLNCWRCRSCRTTGSRSGCIATGKSSASEQSDQPALRRLTIRWRSADVGSGTTDGEGCSSSSRSRCRNHSETSLRRSSASRWPT